ncbi:hypothetical protein [Amycolatopsis nigrescens]|uniref:hypothetical protein n=1 Tax=Amycolatopsis nigrescens TaxID=381445 RepID=UPI000364100E|nr:hypothetical protein [Amycolatopsis nigrescens]
MTDFHCLPYPPLEPEPDGDELSSPVDWMTYSHRELYNMVHRGIDLAGATAVAAQWAKVGDVLDEVGASLRRAADASQHGWDGLAADTARTTMDRLVTWTGDSGDLAKDVSGCVSRQADLAETARRSMPEPPGFNLPDPGPHPNPGPAPPPRFPRTLPVPQTGGTSAMSASSGSFSSAESIIADPGPDRERSQQLHQQAAGVMRKLQNESSEIYSTVPSFRSPNATSVLSEPEPPPAEPPEPPTEDPGQTTTSSVESGPVATPAPGSPAAGTPNQPAPGAVLGNAPGHGTGEQLGQGNKSGLGAGQQPAAGSAAAAAAAQRGAMPGMAGMPMGAGMAPRQDDEERKLPSYLQEESDFWQVNGPVVPPVLGERDN